MQRLGLHLAHRVIGTACLIAVLLAVTACDRNTDGSKTQTASDDWREFEGTWNAAGTRRTIPLGEERRGSIVDLRGSMLLAGSGRPDVGFRAEVIALVDSETGLLGRGVWTDEHGDQVYSELQGEGTAATNHIAGTILSGTGRYAGISGTYEFSWQRVTEGEEGAVQGRAVDLQGRVRVAGRAGESQP